jgi:hypothetical protein
MWQGLREGMRTGVALHDFTGDGYLDAVIGNYRGGISFWRNDFAATAASPAPISASEAFLLLPNPVQEQAIVALSMEPTADARIELMDAQGRTVLRTRLLAKQYRLDTHDLAPGPYLVTIATGTQRWSQRLVVLR